MLVWLEHTCENIHGDCTLNSSTVTGKDVFFKKRILLNPTLEVSSNKISSHVPPQFCHSRDLTLQLIDELLVEAEANWGENRWFVWIGGYWFCVQLSQGLNFPKFLNLGLLLERTPPPKRPSLMKEMTFRICAVITLGITWCSLSWNMDTRSIAKLWRISWKQTFWALLSIATQATWWKRPYPTALLRRV